jgi:hypothetical protein
MLAGMLDDPFGVLEWNCVRPGADLVYERQARNNIVQHQRVGHLAGYLELGGLGFLLIRPDETSTPVRAEPVEGLRVKPGLRHAQPERKLVLHRAGSILSKPVQT